MMTVNWFQPTGPYYIKPLKSHWPLQIAAEYKSVSFFFPFPLLLPKSIPESEGTGKGGDWVPVMWYFGVFSVDCILHHLIIINIYSSKVFFSVFVIIVVAVVVVAVVLSLFSSLSLSLPLLLLSSLKLLLLVVVVITSVELFNFSTTKTVSFILQIKSSSFNSFLLLLLSFLLLLLSLLSLLFHYYCYYYRDHYAY